MTSLLSHLRGAEFSEVFLQLCPDDRVHGNETEHAGLPDGALLVSVASDESRDQVGQFGPEVARR